MEHVSSMLLFIDREAGEIIRLVASVCPSVRYHSHFVISAVPLNVYFRGVRQAAITREGTLLPGEGGTIGP